MKHLPLQDWPEADVAAFAEAYEPGDVFDETAGSGAHLSEGTRRTIQTAYRRWLGFLRAHYPDDLLKAPAERIMPERLRAFIDHLVAEVRLSSVTIVVANLYYAARLIAPEADWRWLASIKARLVSRAIPENRFDRLVPGWDTLDLGIELMETAKGSTSDRGKERDLQYRDGLILVLPSLWNIRRRSLAALTLTRHIEFDQAGVNLLLHPEDTKSKREESRMRYSLTLCAILRPLGRGLSAATSMTDCGHPAKAAR